MDVAAAAAAAKSNVVQEFTTQANRLSESGRSGEDNGLDSTAVIEAKYITPLDVVLETVDRRRLPGVPLYEAQKLNQLKRKIDQGEQAQNPLEGPEEETKVEQSSALRTSAPPSSTHPLFPPLPLYGPPSLLRNLQCLTFRVSSFFLSLAFLGSIVVGSALSSIPLMLQHIGLRLIFRSPDARRPFYAEEKTRRKARREAEKEWGRQRRRRKSQDQSARDESDVDDLESFEPTEGGRDPIVCDVSYYARRVGLDIEEYRVQTEDGFIIKLWHVYNPKERRPKSTAEREQRGPEVFSSDSHKPDDSTPGSTKRRYPVLMIHGLLQSSGAYCTNDDRSLAFFLSKSGYDVWLGNNRCGFDPEHTILKPSDPRMWAWNIRQMGVIDLSAFVSRVLHETGFPKLALVCHSQGTTETFVALAKGQRPELGEKISVFCALAPAAYAGPLINTAYFKFISLLSPVLFRIVFGIHAFIPFMMTMHRLLPGQLYGAMGYRVFAYLFQWTDDRWERDLRDRMFQFAPVYVSAESMRWWLGRECFARHRCILSTKEERKREEREDAEETADEAATEKEGLSYDERHGREKGSTAWYDERAPPMALWIPGSDDLVDGRRLLRRFRLGREPYVNLVHTKVIEEYEHLDVIWAMDSIEKIGKEVRSVIWSTASEDLRKSCVIPKGLGDVPS
ncbi:MAG: hypothetical protein M1814_001311 [Vezdaea aestivalis]|nr:MAG: hypothetical protein M1814_001311 [Vezdaea aestivalis]